ncbi:molybdopterin molybdotransferase MoeA [Curtobacterium flaccumfaciens pv. flaccumfaciens]|uniref:molybdopterin molybdotransferase MoeA n=1 Tax=Curtobacterium flaccumfaciens TaxID=2035 RepID=UPI00217D3086|nr:gephyrin-like molybdotransferase Glp [Curtobacterium flaccumfaciens]MCS6547820.1 molybdopterin molybdotransferase MoeA [Curtobacterium flaccumfaciens pv. flaccumfaciens]
MRTIGQHRDDLAALLAPVVAGLGAEELSIGELAGAGAGFAHRVLAAAVLSPVPLPPFDNSQMDGFAVQAADAGQAVRVVDPIPAGVVPEPLEPGTAAPIMTGARIPTGADAVFPVEATEPGAFPAALELPRVPVPADLTAGTFVRVTGSDLPAGDELAPAGSAVTPALLGALAAAGVTTVSVRRPLRVLVVSTGSELQGADTDAATIGDANGIALRAALAQVGADSRAVRVPDDVAAFDRALDAAVGDWADLVLTTGGISAGAYEVVRQALEPRGLAVTPVAMQPGGPQAFGSVVFGADGVARAGRAVPVVSFPGNPVSALVSFEVFLRPLLAGAVGLTPDRPTQVLPAASAADSPAGKHQVRRGRVQDGAVHFVGGPSSHLLVHYAAATHLVHVPVGVDAVEVGDPLTVWSLR